MTVLVWCVLSVIWGTTWLAIKVGLEYLPPFTFAGVRFIIAGMPLTVLLLFRKPQLPGVKSDWYLIAVTGLLTISANYGLVFWGERHISSGLTSIFYSTYPLFGLVIAHFVLATERINATKLVGVLVGIAGVVIIFADQLHLSDEEAIWGSFAITLAAALTAFASVLIKARGRHIDPLVLTVGQMAVGFLPLIILAAWLEGNPLSYDWSRASTWGALLYLALVGSALAFVLVYWLIQRMDVTKTTLIPLASTLVAVILGKVVLGETLNWRVLVGGAGIFFGLVINVLGHRSWAQTD